MGVFGTPQRVLVRGEGCTGLGRRRQAIPGPARRHRRQRPRPRPPGLVGGHRAGWPPWATSPTSSPPPRSPWPRGCWTLPGAGRLQGVLRQLRAPRPTRRPSSWPGAPAAAGSSPLEGAFHGRTMGALALTPSRPTASRSNRCARRVDARPVRRRRRAARRRGRPTTGRRLPRTDPGRGRRPAAPAATCGGPRAHPRRRRPADPGRGPDRHRPHRQLVRPPARRASCPTP